MAGEITTILSNPKRLKLIEFFDDEAMNALLVGSLGVQYPPSKAVYEAASDAFTKLLPANVRTGGPGRPLAAKDRERVIVALLAARGEELNLAIHIYSAVALKVKIHDLVHTLLLTGVYTGVPAFAGSLPVAKKTFDTLQAITLTKPTPDKVLPKLQAAFA